jgi:hypothetical protein
MTGAQGPTGLVSITTRPYDSLKDSELQALQSVDFQQRVTRWRVQFQGLTSEFQWLTSVQWPPLPPAVSTHWFKGS